MPNFTRYKHDKDDIKSLSHNWVISLAENDEDGLWIATHGGGLNKFNPETQTFIKYRKGPHNHHGLAHNDLKRVYRDPRQQAIWIGSESGGVYKAAYNQKKFRHYQHDPNDPNTLGHNTLFGMCEDKDGFIWIATQMRGVDKFDPQQKNFSHFRNDHNNPNSLHHDKVQTVFEDRNENLWIGGAHGLARYDRKRDRFINYLDEKNNKDGKAPVWIDEITQDPYSDEEAIWIVTIGSGLVKFYYNENRYVIYNHHPEDPNSLGNPYVITAYFDLDSTKRQLWIGTENGLDQFDIHSEKFTHYRHDPNNPNSLSNNSVWAIHRDKSGALWVGTNGGGLNRFVEEENRFIRFTEKEGLSSNNICRILEDGTGNLWISTFSGLSRFNPRTKIFKNFFSGDGLQSDEFWPLSAVKSKSGLMYFGGINGLTVFHPDSISENKNIPPLVLTDLRIFNQSIKPGGKSPLSRSISESEEMVLSYDQDIFTLEFAALDFTIPSNNKYAYIMEGVDRDWVYTDASRRFATYTKLDPGNYRFVVKGSNNDGIWNEKGTSIRIIILPPWWQTKWAYLLYIILAIALIISVWKTQLNRLRMKHQRELEHVETEKLKEVDRIKTHFFANISHEFRTPLTLIKGPVENLIHGDFRGNLKEQGKLILRNINHLLSLVNQLLDLSKLESDMMRLHAEKTNLVPILKGLVQSFASLAKQKNITLEFIPLKDPVELYLDREKFEKIINNLLSNAFKFTPEEGNIVVDCGLWNSDLQKELDSELQITDYNSIQIKISNSGPGIPPDQMDKIFDRFYQIDDSQTRRFGGTGIGLALVKELVDLHHGKITVSTVPGKRTTFNIFLPFGSEAFSNDEIIHMSKKPSEEITDVPIMSEGEKSHTVMPITVQSREKILIVEDHTDVQDYIGNILADSYRILKADNGLEGLKIARDKMPDLIISDVMMPEMDGYTFCSEIKKDELTSHIPLILLTARAGHEDKMEGLETGADDFLVKPFDSQELAARVKNLIEQRRNLRRRFSREPYLSFNKITTTSVDERFLSQLKTIIEDNITNPGLDVNYLAEEMGNSYTHLYRKIKALVGLSPAAFIRLVRLTKAQQLLKNNHGNISEVAFEVGFESLHYFSRCFSKQYGMSPSVFLKQHRD